MGEERERERESTIPSAYFSRCHLFLNELNEAPTVGLFFFLTVKHCPVQ